MKIKEAKMQITIEVTDDFALLPTKKQEEMKANFQREAARLSLVEVMRKNPGAKTDMSEEEQLEFVDKIRQEVWDEQHK